MKKNNRIYLASPHMCGEEMKFINEAFETNWVAPLGKNVDEFEKEVAAYVGVKYAAALVTGTAAIHLGLKWLGVTQGDYVFCSSLTFSASCNPVVYEKATPVFIDSEKESYNISPAALERAFEWAKKENKMPKAVVIVNLYGTNADWDKLLPICRKYNVPVLEDAAESLGSVYGGKNSGSFGDLSILSFNGNKIITTSGGGMLLSNNEDAVKKARFWATQARDPAPHYEHSEIGYNYRMSNISAGIGRGQLTALEERVKQKAEIHKRYRDSFRGTALQVVEPPAGTSSYWLTIAKIHGNKTSYMDIINALAAENIEARPIWKPMNIQPVYKNCKYFDNGGTGEELFKNGLCLPSDTKMTAEEQDRVIEIVKKVLITAN